MNELIDRHGRTHTYLRISLTDHCNLHCLYCNPLLPNTVGSRRKDSLSFDEVLRLIRFFILECGVTKIRLTGGELFVRKGITGFLKTLGEFKRDHPFMLGVTTNGTLLRQHCTVLKSSGVDAVNISVDSLREDRYEKITGQDGLNEVLEAISVVQSAEFESIKINTVVMRGVNDDELAEFAAFAAEKNLHVRFIEYMPFPNNAWDRQSFMSWRDMKRRIQEKYELIPKISDVHAVGKEYLIGGQKGIIGFITPVSEHFCGSCNRLRLTASGRIKACLFSLPEQEFDVAPLLRGGGTEKEIHAGILAALGMKWKVHPPAEQLAAGGRSTMTGIGG